MWQPIESAPKTGERILLYQNDSNISINVHSWEFMGYEGFGNDKKPWYTWVSCKIYDDYDGFENPTHWMPLLEKPEN